MKTFSMMIEKRWFPPLIITLFVGLVHTNTLFNNFAWDDILVVVKNQALRGTAISLFSGIDTARDIDVSPYYRPLALLSFLIEERIHSLNPLFMHMLNLALHAGISLLVYLLVIPIAENRRTAMLAAILFAVHPINVESVAFISGGRNTLLAAFFALSAYLFHRHGVITKQFRFTFAGAILFMAAILSKETSLAIIVFIVALESSSEINSSDDNRQPAITRLSLYAAACAIYFWLRSQALVNAGATSDIMPGLLSRLTDNIYIIPRYLATIIWPPSSSVRYFIPDDLNLFALPISVTWLLIFVFLGWLIKGGRSQATYFGLAWMVAFWLPTSGIIAFPSAPMADRYLYLSAIGLWIIIADQTVRFFAKSEVACRYGLAITASTLILLSAMTIKHNRVWKDDISLFTDYVEKHPSQAFGHQNLGTAYLDLAKDLDKADYEFQKVLTINPRFPKLHTQLGYIRLLRGDYSGALAHYNEAVVQNPGDAEAHLNRGTVLEKLGKYEEAIYEYKRFLTTPGNELAASRPYANERISELSRLKSDQNKL